MAGSRRRDIEEGRASGSRQVQRWPEVYFLGRRAARHLHQPLRAGPAVSVPVHAVRGYLRGAEPRSEEHTSELQSLMRSSYAVFCLKKKKRKQHKTTLHQ